jgi:methionyl-tRNA formyltransferase
MTHYPYARGDLIENPNSYFYSQFGGRAFIGAWRAARAETLKSHGEPVPPPPARKVDPASRQTGDLLEQALGGSQALREAFVKKFEIHKRVHDGYDLAFRALDKSARHSLPLYLRAADLFAASYAESGSLRHLNVYLKCLDTLCAIARELPPELSGRLTWHLAQEQRFIDDLITDGAVGA